MLSVVHLQALFVNIKCFKQTNLNKIGNSFRAPEPAKMHQLVGLQLKQPNLRIETAITYFAVELKC